MDQKPHWTTVGLWTALVVMVLVGMSGCTLVMQDDGTLEAGIATTLTLKQTGPKEVDRESRIGVEFEDWFKDLMVRTFPEYFGVGSDGEEDEPEDAVDGAADGGDDAVDGT